MASTKQKSDDVIEGEKVVDPASAGKGLVSYDEEIAKRRAALRGQLSAPPSNKISVKGKVFSLPGGESSPGPLNAVILDFVWFLAHYPGVYNPKDPQDPDCWAVGRDLPDGGDLKPHTDVPNPIAENCGICPKNQWGTDNRGRGKDCKNQRRLIFVEPPGKDGYETPPKIMTLYVSPGATKHFDKYIEDLDKIHGLDVTQVVTEMTFDPNEAYPSLRFKMIAKHGHLNEVFPLVKQGEASLMRGIEVKTKAE